MENTSDQKIVSQAENATDVNTVVDFSVVYLSVVDSLKLKPGQYRFRVVSIPDGDGDLFFRLAKL
jgi:hypothetical protein